MRNLALVIVAALALSACESGDAYNPESPITVWIHATPNMNYGGGSGRSVDLYAYAVTAPAEFERAGFTPAPDRIDVPGGRLVDRMYIRPGTDTSWILPAMQTAEYTHIAVIATYGAPYGALRRVAEIPPEASFELVLGPREIQYFGGEEDEENFLLYPGQN